MIKIENLEKIYPNGGRVLHDVNTEIRDGDVISVIGPSGCGKSTFIRCLNQLEKITGGHVWLDGEEITGKATDLQKLRLKVGMVFQEFNLFANMTVVENVMFPQIKVLKKSRQDAYDKAMELLRSVGMAEKALSYPAQLSGGQKQRVAIARALATDPEVVLFDEPTSALDPFMVDEVEMVLKNLAKTGTTMVIVTHSMELAKSISSRVFYLDEGTLYEEGTAHEIFENPKKPKTREFINRAKILELDFASKDFDFVSILTEAMQFADKNEIPLALKKSMRAVMEEFLIMSARWLGRENIRVHTKLSYQPKEEKLSLIIGYTGKPMDARKDLESTDEDDKNISKAIIRLNVLGFDYTYTKDEEFPNRLTFLIGKNKGKK